MVVIKTDLKTKPNRCGECDFCTYDYEYNSGFICGVLMHRYQIELPDIGRLINCPLAEVGDVNG